MHSTVNNTVLEYLTASRFVRRCMRDVTAYNLRENACMNTSSLFHNPALNFKKEAFLTKEECCGTACL